MYLTPSKDAGPAPNASSLQQPPIVKFPGMRRTFTRGSAGMWREEEMGRLALPSFPEEMSNPLLGSYISPSEEVALSGDQPRALHNRHPPPHPLVMAVFGDRHKHLTSTLPCVNTGFIWVVERGLDQSRSWLHAKNEVDTVSEALTSSHQLPSNEWPCGSVVKPRLRSPAACCHPHCLPAMWPGQVVQSHSASAALSAKQGNTCT